MTFEQKIELVDENRERDTQLLEDIMPSVEEFRKTRLVGKENTDGRKSKTWGPIQPTRMSARLELPPRKMAGIISSNPFSILQPSELEHRANLVGVEIREVIDLESIHDSKVDAVDIEPGHPHNASATEAVSDLAEQADVNVRDNSFSSPKKSSNNRIDDLDEIWT